MKKILTGLLVVCLLLGTLTPINVMAQEDAGLEKAIKTAKEKLHIPKEFTEFNYNVNTIEGKKIWNMNWSSKENKDGSIEASVTSGGDILSYNFYKYDQDHEKKLPKYSKAKGKEIAEGFIKKIDPLLYDQLKYEEDQNNKIDKEYSYHYIRMVNNIPFYGNDVRVEVNSETGEVNSFYRNWDKDLVFPKPKDYISLDEGKKAFKEKLGLELIYKYRQDEKIIKPYLVYTTKYNESDCIDAFTGEKVKIKMDYPFLYGNGRDEMTKEAANDAEDIALSPEEIKAVEEASKLLSKEKAEEIARNTKILELSKAFKLSNARLNRDWTTKKDFSWHLYFDEERQENGKKVYNHVNVGIDAVTGKIKSFYISDSYKEDEKAVFDKEASQKAVENFLKEFVPEKYDQTKYDENNDNDDYVKDEQKPLSYTFTYKRMVNNVPFRDNRITVGYNAVTGKVRSFHTQWFDINFPTAKNVVSLDTAYNKMFEDIGLQLEYKIIYNPVSPYDKKTQEVKLVYSLESVKPVIFDGNTCEILDYNGEHYKEEKAIAYKDIKDHHAEKEIQALAENGIGFDEDTFRPDEKITQKDLFGLFVKTLNYYGYNGKDEQSVKEMYDYLIREGIIKENEKAPDTFVTKEAVIKYMIRALKYEEVANIKGIYNYPFTDIEKADKDLVGHITLAYGLGIVKGNGHSLEPKKEISRADAAIMIYQYLNR